MGVNQRVKSKYVFRLPILFHKTRRMNVKGRRDEDDTDEDFDDDNDNTHNVHTNVPHTVHVRYESEVGSEIESDDEDIDFGVSGPPRQRKRLVSWDSVKDQARPRWTMEQEEKLVHARAELARCQKAWSSEQEIWLKCIETLNEEKAAHEDFVNNRAKHIDDEQNHFRKVWNRNRRRSEQDQLQGQAPPLTQNHRRTASQQGRLGRFRGGN
ncbi:hypothetical protein BJX76DRAFT_363072 [Aspergillus varians]